MPNFGVVWGGARGRVSRRAGVAAVLAAGTLTLSACGSESAQTATPGGSDATPVVLTTFTVLADMAANVAGDDIRIESITKIGSEIHGYEPTPGDIRRAQDADLILDNGLGLEAWFARFVESVDAPHVEASAQVEPIDIASDAYAGTPNPHAWMSPSDAVLYVDEIATAFADLDPDNADDYRARADDYSAEIEAVASELSGAVDTLPERHRALVTCEGAFSYLARDAGLTEVYLWPVNAEQQATPQQVAATIEYVEDNDVPAVFCESTVSDKAMQQVVEATGTTFGGTLYVDSLSEEGGPVPTYLELLRYDVDLIVDGLTNGAS